MNRIAFIAALFYAAQAHAAAVHLQTLEHVATFDAVPTVKRIEYLGAADLPRQWRVTYDDSDLGRTTWQASDEDIREWRRLATMPTHHFGYSNTMSIGDLRHITTSDVIPLNRTSTYKDGASTVIATMVNPTYLWPPVITDVQMELSPFTDMGDGHYKVTQTVRIYGAIPEPRGVVMMLVGIVFAGLTPRFVRR
jgi:hypothetical protein